LKNKQELWKIFQQMFENIAGVMGNNPQLLQFSLINPSQSWWTHYIFICKIKHYDIILIRNI